MTTTAMAAFSTQTAPRRTIGKATVCVFMALALSACGRIGLNDPLAPSTQRETTYEPLPAAPAASVTTSALPPPPVVAAPTVTAPAGGTAVDPAQATTPPAGTAAGIPLASNTPARTPEPVASDKGPAIGRGELAGAWRIASSADNCQLFLTLTTWSGGARASTKGCNSAEMQRITAWDLVGRQVNLKSGDGAVVATLTNAGPEKWAGQTASKQAISLSH